MFFTIVFLFFCGVSDVLAGQQHIADISLKNPSVVNTQHSQRFNANEIRVFPFKGSQGVIAPLVINNKVIFLNSKGSLYSLDNKDLNKVFWKIDLTSSEYYSGGLSYSNGLIICVLENTIYGINLTDGKIKWKKELRTVVTGEPVISEDKKSIAIVTIDSYLYVLGLSDGSVIWTYQGAIPDLKSINALSPAIKGKVIVVPFPNSEIIAFDISNGRKLWENRLSVSSIYNLFNDMSVTPIIYDNKVIVVNNSNGIVSFDLNSGKEIWSKQMNVKNVSTAIKGKIFVVTDDKVVALDVNTGRSFQKYDLFDTNKMSKSVKWNVPVVVNDQLWVSSNSGELVSFDYQTGIRKYVIKIPSKSYHAPVVANYSMYISTNGNGLVLIS